MKYFLTACFGLTAIFCLILLLSPDWLMPSEKPPVAAIKTIAPRSDSWKANDEEASSLERQVYEDENAPKTAIKDGEILVSVLTSNLDNDPQEEQVIAYRLQDDESTAVYLAYIDFDQDNGLYERIWNDRTAVTRPRTFSLYIKDLIGDRSACIIAGGLNDSGEQTLTVFRKDPEAAFNEPLVKIAELHTDGSIVVKEKDRSQAYHLGLAAGQSFAIASYGRDYESGNLLDQIETTYSWDFSTGRYERTATARIPGIQIEQRRVHELLSGTPANFERFLDGLWVFSPSAGEDSSSRFVHFDPEQREVIFYADNTQEVYSWQNSNATRYGLYLTTQNISVITLRRLIDIELTSIDTIRLKVFEDVRLKIGISGLWDGSYRKLDSLRTPADSSTTLAARETAVYQGTSGSLSLSNDGLYKLTTGNDYQTGNYAFFSLLGDEFLGLRPNAGQTAQAATYLVIRDKPGSPTESLRLRPVKLTANGVQALLMDDLDFTKILETAQNPNP